MALKEKYEKFAQGMVIHNNATEAARFAGYTANSSHALANTGFRLKNLPEIKDRIKELEDNLETNVDVITEIERQYDFAKSNGHTNSAIKALELLSKIRGAKSDKEVNIRKKKKEAIAEAKRKQAQMIENTILGALVIFFLGAVGAVLYLILSVD